MAGAAVWMAGGSRPRVQGVRAPLAAPKTLAALAVGFWATNALAGGAALATLSLPQQLTFQFTSAWVVLAAARRWAPPRTDAPAGSAAFAVALGVIGVTGTISLQYLAFATAPLVQANIVAYAWPLLVGVGLALTRLDREALRSMGLAAVGFAGVALMVAGGDSGGGGGSTAGLFAAAGSAACMALFTFGAPRIAGREQQALMWATALGAAGSLLAMLLTGLPGDVGPGMLAAIYTGVGPMAAGYLFWTRAMASPSGRSLAPLAYATPLLSTVLLVATGSAIGGLGLVGAAITLAAIVAVLARS